MTARIEIILFYYRLRFYISVDNAMRFLPLSIIIFLGFVGGKLMLGMYEDVPGYYPFADFTVAFFAFTGLSFLSFSNPHER